VNKKMQTEYHPNGAIKSIVHRQNGRTHRDDGPAVQRWNDAGMLIVEGWCQNGCYHRNNGPAYQQWNDAGELIDEGWWQNEYPHRNDGPAIQKWNSAGKLIWEKWYQKGNIHRDDGPAYQRWNSAGELIWEDWWQNNRKSTAEEIEKLMRPADIMAAIWTLPQPIAEEIASVFRAC